MSDERGSSRVLPPPAKGDHGPQNRVYQLFGLSRYIVSAAVISTFAGSALLLVYGSLQTLRLITDTFAQPGISSEWAQHLRLEVIEVVDLFLIATVLFIIAVGLFQLFLADINVPRWLNVEGVGGLEEKLVGMVITVIAVFFLGELLGGETEDLQAMGIAIAVVIAALTYFLTHLSQSRSGGDE